VLAQHCLGCIASHDHDVDAIVVDLVGEEALDAVENAHALTNLWELLQAFTTDKASSSAISLISMDSKSGTCIAGIL
jgi:hypothetical protein